MENCLRVLKRTRQNFHNQNNVIGVGVGMKRVGLERTKQPSIVVFVEKKIPKESLHRSEIIPPKINGVYTDVIEIGKVRLLDSRTDKSRPAKPGMSIGHYRVTAGTFGALVRDQKTGEALILSNNHILANSTDGSDGRAVPGDSILQPGAYDGGTSQDAIAELVRYVPIIRSVKEADCPVAMGVAGMGSKLVHLIKPNYDMRFIKRFRGSNIVDAAAARPLSPEVVVSDILDVGVIEGTAVAEVDLEVIKSGRSSGITNGRVTAISVSLEVELSDSETGLFSDQVVADMVSKGGDSGSLVLDERRKAVGLLFAGSDKFTVFNHLKNVMDSLGIVL